MRPPGWHEQRDKNVWNEGPVNGQVHDVEDFWAERFLVYPNDPSSGPRKSNTMSIPKTQKHNSSAGNEPKFTTESVTGSFIPYGGGQKMCPGRFYAKQQALGAMALFLAMFDIELKEKDKLPLPNMNFFAFGVIPPNGKIPARIRRRKLA
jgi:cytochrome P450